MFTMPPVKSGVTGRWSVAETVRCRSVGATVFDQQNDVPFDRRRWLVARRQHDHNAPILAPGLAGRWSSAAPLRRVTHRQALCAMQRRAPHRVRPHHRAPPLNDGARSARRGVTPRSGVTRQEQSPLVNAPRCARSPGALRHAVPRPAGSASASGTTAERRGAERPAGRDAAERRFTSW